MKFSLSLLIILLFVPLAAQHAAELPNIVDKATHWMESQPKDRPFFLYFNSLRWLCITP
jgi:hypothetical protein